MKFLIAFITFCLTVIAVVYILHSTPTSETTEAKSKVGSISVSASHSEVYSPSSVVVSLYFNSRNSEKNILVEASKKRIAELVEFASTLNIPQDSITAQQFSLEKAWTWENNKRKSDGFEISQRISVRISDPQKISRFIEGIATIPDMEIRNVSPVLANENEKKNDVYKTAVEEATQKAKSLAKASGKKLGKVLFVSDGSASTDNFDMIETTALGASAMMRKNSVMSEQKIQISASVLMQFELK